MVTALTHGDRLGIIAILPASVPCHVRTVRSMELERCFTASRTIGLGIAELNDVDAVMERMIAVGACLRDEQDANVVIMGCAGLARFKDGLEDALAIPVVEPSQAAVTLAIGAVLLTRAK